MSSRVWYHTSSGSRLRGHQGDLGGHSGQEIKAGPVGEGVDNYDDSDDDSDDDDGDIVDDIVDDVDAVGKDHQAGHTLALRRSTSDLGLALGGVHFPGFDFDGCSDGDDMSQSSVGENSNCGD